jgi:hypothetical protein
VTPFEQTVKALDAACTVEQIENALRLMGHKSAELTFPQLMANQGAADRAAQLSAQCKASQLLGQWVAQGHRRVVDLAEQTNVASHPKFVLAMLRALEVPA